MRIFLQRITLTFLMIALIGISLNVKSAFAASGTPGSYVYYTLGSGTYSNVTFTQKMETDPGRGNVFWSNQFNFTNAGVAYVGYQTHKDGGGMFLFSVWNATVAIPGSTGTYCTQFGGEGTGSSCRKDVRPIEGHTYQFTISDQGNGYFGATVSDTTAGTSFELGKIQVGSGNAISGDLQTWTEYFDWSNSNAQCEDEPYSKLRVDPPTANNGAITGTLTGTSKTTTCTNYTNVTVSGNSAIQENGIGNSYAGILVNSNSGLCADATGFGSTPGTVIEQWTCSNGSNQVFVFAADGTLHTQFSNVGTQGGTTANGTTVALAAPDGSASQQWSLQGDGSIKNGSGLVLDVPGSSTANGTVLIIWNPNGGNNQKWIFSK
jgi:hypothetical protein